MGRLGHTQTGSDTGADLLGALHQLMQDPGVRESAGFVDAVLDVTLIRGDAEPVSLSIDLRQGDEADARIEIVLHASAARELLRGDAHESLLFMSGALRVGGELDSLFRLIRALRPISQRYNQLTGETPTHPDRVAVLKRYDITREQLVGAGIPNTIDASNFEQQVQLAALILLGIHPACRRLEVGALLEADLAADRLLLLSRFLTSLVAHGVGVTLTDTTRGIEAVVHPAT